MVEALPHYNLFAEHLRDCGQLTTRFWQTFGGGPPW